MARPKEFNRDEALDRAVLVFWAQGFEATTMTDLRQAMGIGRQSLYDTFGDKKQVFAEVLQRYVGMNDSWLDQVLGGRGLAGIEDYLAGVVGQMTGPSVRTGCLMMNTCVELAARDAGVADHTAAGLGSLQAALEAALGRAAALGEISQEIDTTRHALFLTNQVAGITVMAKAGATKNQLEEIAGLALSTLR